VLRAGLVFLVVGAACSSSGSGDPPPTPAPQHPSDAGVIDGITSIGSYDPASGRHLDDDVPRTAVQHQKSNRPAKPIDVVLKSTPAGAMAAVDGSPIGYTPTLWQGDADGREHDFTFEKPGHTLAHYRFIPIASGVVHARLVPIADDRLDAGVGSSAAPPTFTPDASPSAPPIDAPVVPLVVSPADASSSGSSGSSTPGGAGPQP
jgi:hypothetical protein